MRTILTVRQWLAGQSYVIDPIAIIGVSIIAVSIIGIALLAIDDYTIVGIADNGLVLPLFEFLRQGIRMLKGLV